ncbi:MAG TPA: hypothetical protein VLI91_09910 [Roseiarcus sp.]|nr:hypothetical protein [Roseiarcus sp.]
MVSSYLFTVCAPICKTQSYFGIGVLFILVGCSEISPTLRSPDRIIPLQNEIASLQAALSEPTILASANSTFVGRNAYITERMYGIDLEYTHYEALLTSSTSDANLLAAITTIGLTGTASVLNVPQTNKILSAIAAGVTGASQAYDKDILLSQAIQNLQMQMRTDRNNQAKIIIANMKCDIVKYPLGMALSDLETYYRVGTLESAEIAISRTVSNAEDTSKANKESVNPSPAVSQPAQDKLKNDATLGTSQASASSGANQQASATLVAIDSSGPAACRNVKRGKA